MEKLILSYCFLAIIGFSYDATANRYRYNGKEEIDADAVVDSLLQISIIDKENVDKIKEIYKG